MARQTEITPADILSMEDYEKIRLARRREIADMKKPRRISVGPHATFYFECYDTMWYQIHEMLRIEKGGEAQMADELEAYNPLIPKGSELVATVMFEIPDAQRRTEILGGLGGVEETITLDIGGEEISGDPETDLDRTNAQGKASSVQFVHFHLNPAQIEKFKSPGSRVVLAINHPNYGHMAVLGQETVAELARDFA